MVLSYGITFYWCYIWISVCTTHIYIDLLRDDLKQLKRRKKVKGTAIII